MSTLDLKLLLLRSKFARQERSPNSAGSQFFICLKNAHWLDGNYTAFGKVIENIQVFDFIADTPTDYLVAKAKCIHSLPPNQNMDQWIELVDPNSIHWSIF